MNIKTRILFMTMMLLGLSFGFFGLFFPRMQAYTFERLHIFLFNLCTGCTIILYYSEGQKTVSPRTLWFLILALGYAVSAFFNRYLPATIIAFILPVITETVRIKRFGYFPWMFFKPGVPVHEKFHHASLLCLSIGLFLSGCIMINTVYYPVIVMPKLKLDVFYLGFSFPVSLITLSVVFSLMKSDITVKEKILKEISFWTVNLGVIIFFIFILLEKMIPQIIVTLLLTLCVILMFVLFIRLGKREQQKKFLLSGMLFLLVTAVTGIAYIVLTFSPAYDSTQIKWLLKLHAVVSLYGWNLSGLSVIMRFDSFPIKLNSSLVILFHWAIVTILAPLGNNLRFFSVLTILCYAVFLYVILFSRETEKMQI